MAPEQTELLKGTLRASALTIEQYEEAGPGQNCQLVWSITSSTLDISKDHRSGCATELEGELFHNGKKAYKFHAHKATVTEMHQQDSSIQVEGDVEVAELLSGARINCGTLAWEPAVDTLSLGGKVTVTFQPGLVVTSPKLVICNINSFDNLQRRITRDLGFDKELFSPIQNRRRLGGSLLFLGPCCIKLKAPDLIKNAKLDSFLGLSKRDKFLLNIFCQAKHSVKKFCKLQDYKATSYEPAVYNIPDTHFSERHPLTGYGICVKAKQGLHIDMKEGHVSLRGPVGVSWPGKDAKVSAGGVEILLMDGTCVLHNQVSAQIQSFNLKASKVTWLMCQKIPEAGSLISQKCQPQSCSQQSNWLTSDLHGTPRFRGLTDDGHGRPQEASMVPYPRNTEILSENFKALIRGIGAVCQWTSYPPLTSRFSSGIAYGNTKIRKVIFNEKKRFSSFAVILLPIFQGFVSAWKVSFTSKSYITSQRFFVGVEVGLSDLLRERLQRGRDIQDDLKQDVQEKAEFFHSSFAVQVALEEKAKYCKSLKCNILIAEGALDIS